MITTLPLTRLTCCSCTALFPFRLVVHRSVRVAPPPVHMMPRLRLGAIAPRFHDGRLRPSAAAGVKKHRRRTLTGSSTPCSYLYVTVELEMGASLSKTSVLGSYGEIGTAEFRSAGQPGAAVPTWSWIDKRF